MTATLLDHLSELILGLEHWGYVIVFLIVVLECQAFLGLFMPGESIVMLAGFFAGQEVFDIRVLIGVVAAAAIIGDSIGYEFGRWLGRDWLRRHGATFWLRAERLDQMDAFFARYGGMSVFFAHFLHVGRALMPFLAGASRLPYLRFLIYNGIGCALWAAIFSLLGYIFGQSWHLIEHWIGRASVLGAILVGALIAMVWLWRWITRRELEIRGWWRRFCARPVVANLRNRFAIQIDWLERRFSPEGFLGIHLTVGVLLLLAATAIFSGLVQQIGTRDLFVALDLRVADWFENHTAAPMDATMLYITRLKSTIWLAALVLAAALIWRHDRHHLRVLVLAVPGGVLLDFFLKQFFAWARPHLSDDSFSVMQMDMMGATVVYGTLAYLLVRSLRRWRWRALVAVLPLLLLLLIALSSLYLRASLLSILLAAIIEGVVWLLLCISGVEIVRWRENAHRDTSARTQEVK